MKPMKRKNRKTIDMEHETLIQTQYLESTLYGDRSNGLRSLNEERSDFCTDDDDEHNAAGHIPAEAKRILDSWMFAHRYYCYPNKLEKQQLAHATKLSVQRISNWFVNSRRRSLPKIIQNDGKNVSDFIITRKRQRKNLAVKNEEQTAKQEPAFLGGNTCDADDEFEYTLAGKRLPKRPTTMRRPSPVPSSVGSETCIRTIAVGADTPPANSSTNEPTKKTCITGIIDDQTTNVKYLYILVQPSQWDDTKCSIDFYYDSVLCFTTINRWKNIVWCSFQKALSSYSLVRFDAN